MRTVVAAYHDMGRVALECLRDCGFEIAAIFTHPDDPGEHLWFESVAEWGARNSIGVFSPSDINHPIWVEKIRELSPEILFSFCYRSIISQRVLEIAPRGGFNLHPSLLPKYRGRAPVNWAVIRGEKVTGVTLHHMTERADAGDIVCQSAVPISDTDTAGQVYERLVAEADTLLRANLVELKTGRSPRIAQNERVATKFARRTPADGQIDWSVSATQVANLVRGLTRPYPGAFTHHHAKKVFVWDARPVRQRNLADEPPGTVLETHPLTIACATGALEIRFGQIEGDVYRTGGELAQTLNLKPGGRVRDETTLRRKKHQTRVLILGVNGFIGNALGERLLEEGGYEVHGMDLNDNAITRFANSRDFYFHEGDIAIHREWIEYHVKKCDVVVPLVAIATPIEYTRNPLRVFELDFEENLRVVRYCAKYGKRVVFPSTSEVYGMASDLVFDEDRTNLVLGPINKQRWIYSSAKQLLDRVIWAYGQQENLRFTLFRPFNWIGPRLDSLESARIGSSRAITQLILNLVDGTPIQLIDGGEQQRCFTSVDDGIDCLHRIIENRAGRCDGQIINIGNPRNEASIRELAEMLIEMFDRHPHRAEFPGFAGLELVESRRYYGEGYEDVQHRRPSIRNAERLLGWRPKIGLRECVESTLNFFLEEQLGERAASGLPAALDDYRVANS